MCGFCFVGFYFLSFFLLFCIKMWFIDGVHIVGFMFVPVGPSKLAKCVASLYKQQHEASPR